MTREEVKRASRVDFWQGIMLGLTLLLVCIGLFGFYVRGQDNSIADNRARTTISEIKADSSQQTIKLGIQNQILREQGELITCLLAIHAPENFPGADQQKCRTKVSGVNNTDGSFLSGSGFPVPPEPGSQDLPSQAQNIPPNTETTIVDRVLNLIEQINPIKENH